MGYCQGIVWLRTQGEFSLFLSLSLFLSFPLAFSLAFFFSLFLPLVLSLSLSFHFDLEPLLFYYFQTRHFFSETVLSVFLSFSFSSPLWAWRGNVAKKYVGNRPVEATGPLRRIINVDRWTNSPWWRVKAHRGSRARIFFHVYTLLLEMKRVRTRS